MTSSTSSTSSLADELNARAVDTDGVHQALRYYLAERLDDLPPEDMLKQMYEAADRDRVDAACAELGRDPRSLENAALVVLSAAWAEESERDRLRAVLTETKGKMPVIEVGIIAIACMFGMYLLATRGIRRHEKTTTHKPDGTFVEREKTEYVNPADALGSIVDLFRQQGR
ncbi:hypothetical protein [Streptomyces hoynatensis]|uniref:Uncharacterized protein n=1 Tax=Streptomyces hoynatensis TaxID=1141874 RepID=A0A3A9YUS8_9ACTN|nr:hypothetical protein [Streptomyces hoynatensis]RKN38966.1 hypothetical protein D7294_22525 [Streptomyces hoynatensis]